jgi:hypothetical protein
VEVLEHEAEHLENLASYRHCTERIQTAWPRSRAARLLKGDLGRHI